jgi:predicted nuclease of predicted toxin-antitoxin system
MNLYLDDDSAKGSLVRLLQKGGHHAVIPADAGLSGVSDPRHFRHTVQQNLVLLTKNHDDFEDLHLLIQTTGGGHPGLLVVRLDNDPNRDMKDRDIVRAIANLEQVGVAIANEFHILNHWR